MPKLSLIVPVYNSERYIDCCLESIAGQTLDDIEIILVDDHGTDSTMERAREFLDGYRGAKRFILTSTDVNSGPGVARNVGIGVATGEYVAFVDSDDTIDPEFCSVLYDTASSQDADLACCDIIIGDREIRNADTRDKKKFLRHFVTYFTTFVYRRSMLMEHDIRFVRLRNAEDTCFLSCCILSANKVAQVHRPMYVYRVNDASLSRMKNRKRAVWRIRSMKHLLSYAKSNGYYRENRPELFLLLIKKGYAMALKDILFG